ncbi:tRNA N(3)-methylcytidine methyltransferase METTL6-like [Hydractinia symbiolongicarpus]|uniref:tRNA N(3)-methylcytidine methyltransferase METTL6-like n=1 Tax=Hydractinia symbiolongicarpus TaxID=13093 RepID=UPI00254C79A8|nr:tRNA N(3)-methylcytidine methyltransferase METTL6-like [Hydractinia symbiolongicarpus]
MNTLEKQGLTATYPVAQSSLSYPKSLSDKEKIRLKEDKVLVSPFKQNKLELEAQKNWDLFYKRNSTKFFKDRHWTHREFPELTSENLSTQGYKILEVGCGCGNTIFPVIEENKHVFVYACDFSPRAVNFVKENPLFDEDRCSVFQCDLTKDDLRENIAEDSIDLVTVIFVLSAILPSNMQQVVQNIARIVKPGGVILFRDYGLYDHAMLRFKPGHKLDENLYVRQDGTRAYYFSLEYAEDLFSSVGFKVIENTYIHKRTVNKKEEVDVPRIFIQGKYKKADLTE